MPTPTAMPRTSRAPSGNIATGSSTPSTRTCPSTASPSSKSPATCCPIRRRTRFIATAFHRNTLTNNEGGTDDEEFRVVAVVDRVNTTMQVWMGLTMALRPVPRSQVRPDQPGGIFPHLRDLQSDRGLRQGDNSPNLATPLAGAIRQKKPSSNSRSPSWKGAATPIRSSPRRQQKWEKTRRQAAKLPANIKTDPALLDATKRIHSRS